MLFLGCSLRQAQGTVFFLAKQYLAMDGGLTTRRLGQAKPALEFSTKTPLAIASTAGIGGARRRRVAAGNGAGAEPRKAPQRWPPCHFFLVGKRQLLLAVLCPFDRLRDRRDRALCVLKKMARCSFMKHLFNQKSAARKI